MVGNINVALIFGLLQFVSTFLIAALYGRFANRKLDPLGQRAERQVQEGAPPVNVDPLVCSPWPTPSRATGP